MRRRIHACHMRRKIHACHMGRRIHAIGSVGIISRSIEFISWRLLFEERELHELVAQLHERLPHLVVQRKQLDLEQILLFTLATHQQHISNTLGTRC
jgi:hypothetical protein